MSAPELPVLGWAIQYSLEGYARYTVSGHNCVADYRGFDPGATSIELTSMPTATATITQLRTELEASRERCEFMLAMTREAQQIASTAQSELEASRLECERLARLIQDHNEGCIASCEANVSAKNCEGFVSRGRNCPNCPRFDTIDAAMKKERT